MTARRRVPVAGTACLTVADLAAVVMCEFIVPRSAWWLPVLTSAGGLAVIWFAFWLIRLADQPRGLRPAWRLERGRPAALPRPAQPRLDARYTLHIDPSWPRSQLPLAIESPAIPGPARGVITEGK